MNQQNGIRRYIPIVEKMIYREVEINNSVEDFSAPKLERSQYQNSNKTIPHNDYLTRSYYFRFHFFALT